MSIRSPGATLPHPAPEATIATAPGSRPAFAPLDWLLLTTCALIWGSSFILTAVALDDFPPAIVTFVRLALGALTLGLFRRARVRIPRRDLGRVAMIGVVWMALPLTLFPIAQQWIDSSIAGMINGAMPLFAAAVSASFLRRLPGRAQLSGLLVGFLGIVAITWPLARGADASALGVLLSLAAVTCYGFAVNLAVPMQQRYGALPVIFRAQLFALALTALPAIFALPSSGFGWPAALSMVPIGVLGTGLAFAAMTLLVGRAGAPRGAIATYFVPVVAVTLGVLLGREEVAAVSFVGMALVLAGAWLTSRRELPRH